MAEDINSTPNITTQFDDYFTPSYAARKVEELLDPLLLFNRPGFLTSFVGSPEHVLETPPYRVNSSGSQSTPGSSSEKRRPNLHVDGTRFSAIDVEDYAVSEYSMTPSGIKLHFDESTMEDRPVNRMKVRQGYEDMARMVQEFINWEILDTALNSFSYTSGGDHTGYVDNEDSTGFGYESTYGFLCGKLASGTYWNSDSADYNTDIKNFKTMFNNQQGYDVQLTTMLMDNTLMEDLVLWGTENGHKWETSPLPGGRDLLRIHGIDLISLNNVDGMTSHTGKVILLDNRSPPCTTYYYNKGYPGYTRWDDDAMVQTKVIEPDPELGDKEVLYRWEFGTVLHRPKHIGIAEVY